jgi:hypothetical protein
VNIADHQVHTSQLSSTSGFGFHNDKLDVEKNGDPFGSTLVTNLGHISF